MRISLPLMLLVSCVLHLGFVAGFVLTYHKGTVKHQAFSHEVSDPAPTVLVLGDQESTPISHRQPASSPAKADKLGSSAVDAKAVPVESKSKTENKKAPVDASSSLALETNPNALIRALQPEAILAPNPAPVLNSADGIVFILDISGSMYEPFAGSTRLAYARQDLRQRLQNLADKTPFAVVLYAQSAYVSGPLVAASNATRDAAVRFIMRDVDCGGGTNLPGGLTAAAQLHPGALVLVTDGDLNISQANLKTQAQAILGANNQGPQLTIVGVAPRTKSGDDRLLQNLADQQHGSYMAAQITAEPSLVSSAAGPGKPAASTP